MLRRCFGHRAPGPHSLRDEHPSQRSRSPGMRGEQGLVGPYCTSDGAGRARGDEQVRRDAGSTLAFVPVLVSPAVCCYPVATVKRGFGGSPLWRVVAGASAFSCKACSTLSAARRSPRVGST